MSGQQENWCQKSRCPVLSPFESDGQWTMSNNTIKPGPLPHVQMTLFLTGPVAQDSFAFSSDTYETSHPLCSATWCLTDTKALTFPLGLQCLPCQMPIDCKLYSCNAISCTNAGRCWGTQVLHCKIERKNKAFNFTHCHWRVHRAYRVRIH